MGRATCPSRFVSRYDELPRRPIRSARYSGESEFGFSQFRTLQRIGDISEDDLKGCMTSKTPSLFQEGIRFQDGTLQTTAAISGSGNFLQVEVDFGFDSGNEGDIARTTVTGQSWVTADSVILCNPFAGMTVDHSPDDAIVEGLVAYAENLVAGVGFDVVVYAPQNSWGKYLVNVTGR